MGCEVQDGQCCVPQVRPVPGRGEIRTAFGTMAIDAVGWRSRRRLAAGSCGCQCGQWDSHCWVGARNRRAARRAGSGRRWQAGHAPTVPGARGLTDALHRAGYSEVELLAAGLAIPARTGTRVVDPIRGQLVTP